MTPEAESPPKQIKLSPLTEAVAEWPARGHGHAGCDSEGSRFRLLCKLLPGKTCHEATPTARTVLSGVMCQRRLFAS